MRATAEPRAGAKGPGAGGARGTVKEEVLETDPHKRGRGAPLRATRRIVHVWLIASALLCIAGAGLLWTVNHAGQTMEAAQHKRRHCEDDDDGVDDYGADFAERPSRGTAKPHHPCSTKAKAPTPHFTKATVDDVVSDGLHLCPDITQIDRSASATLPTVLRSPAPTTNAKAQATRHARNVLVVLADDLGIGDLSVSAYFPPLTKAKATRAQVQTPAHTPNIETLASESTVLTNFYAAAAVCTPTRASIMTSLFPYRFNITDVFATPGDFANPRWLPRVPTMPAAFRSAGFRTGHVGKWHLGGMAPDDLARRRDEHDCWRPGPSQHGFDHWVSIEQGENAWYSTDSKDRKVLYSEGAQHLMENEQPSTASSDVVTDRYVREAKQFMRKAQQDGKRFFLQLWFHAPHNPVEYVYPEAGVYRKWSKTKASRRRYLSIVGHMDTAIGELLQFMDRSGLSKNTLLMFLSDNGAERGTGSSGAYKGGKRYLYEGGIRVPAIVRLPGVVPARTLRTLGVTTDIWPTVVAATGLNMSTLVPSFTDGRSLWPALVADNPTTRQWQDAYTDRLLFWASFVKPETKFAARKGNLKLIVSEQWEVQFFDVGRDPFETNNLVGSRNGTLILKRKDIRAPLTDLVCAVHRLAGMRQRTSTTEERISNCSTPMLDDLRAF